VLLASRAVAATAVMDGSNVLRVAGLAPLSKDQTLQISREQQARLVSQGLLSIRCYTVAVVDVVEADKDDAVVIEQVAAAALERNAVVGAGHWALEQSKGGH
jgi:hypothetical protein